MNLYQLKEILAQSRHPASPSLYSEITQHIDHFVKHDGDPEKARIVDPFALFILLNETSYNVYGQLRRKHEDSFDHFAEKVRFYESECLTDEQLKDAYDAIAELWEDNEREQQHRTDGRLWSTTSTLAKSLYTILSDLEGDDATLDEKLLVLLPKAEYEELKIVKENYYDAH